MSDKKIKKVRIICAGSTFFPGDNLGSKVFNFLQRSPISDTIEVIDGGLQGLNLLKFFDGVDRVILVDSLSGFKSKKKVVILDGIKAVQDSDISFSHSFGLAYLLKSLPQLMGEKLPEIFIIGQEGQASRSTVNKVVQACIKVSDTDSFSHIE